MQANINGETFTLYGHNVVMNTAMKRSIGVYLNGQIISTLFSESDKYDYNIVLYNAIEHHGYNLLEIVEYCLVNGIRFDKWRPDL